MKTYLCKVIGKDGEVEQIRILAKSQENLVDELKLLGYVFISKKKIKSSINNTITEFSIPFFKTLSQLVRNNLNLVISLGIVKSLFKTEESCLIVQDIIDSINSGASFSAALSSFPRFFDRLTIKTIEVSEKTAELPRALSRILEYLESSQQLRNKIKEAIRYPLIVLGVIILVMAFWIFFIVPKFAELFLEIGINPPFISRVVISFSNFISNNIYYDILLLCIIGTVCYKNKFKKLIKRIPIANKIKRESEVFHFFTSMEIMLQEKVNLIDALECLEDSFPKISLVIELIKSGNSLSCAISKMELFSYHEIAIIKSGEESGDLWPAFKSAADMAKANLEIISNRFVSIIQPIAIGVMGFLMIIIIYALIVPLYSNLDIG